MQFLNFLPIRPSVDDNNFAPIKFSLSQNYPNPFNPATTIKYAIPDVSLLHATPQQVTLKVYDILGREIATLVNEKQKPGNHEVKFDSSTNGLSLSSGIYFYRLTAGSFIESRKMVLLK
jgi:myo-inositol-hexaphosphate 3-phosphohydrolase